MTILTVGSSQQFARIADAIAASHDGDTVQIQAGTYLNDFATVNTKITIQGVGGMAHLLATVPPPDGKAILTVNASVTMDHLEFSGAAVADANGAGIRYQGGDLTVTNCYFHDNQDGILGGGGATGSITIRSSEFSHNGAGDGYSHNLYIGDVASLVVDGSYFHDSVVGHEIKSRAESTTITNSRIQDGPTGTGSYSIDVPNGGKVVIQGNVIQQGPNSQNPAIIAFGEEGNVHAGSSLTVTGNTILNDLASPSASAVWNATNAAASVTDNAIYGLPAGQVVRGPAAVSGTTMLTSEPALVTSSPWTTAPAAFPALLTPIPALVSVPTPSASGLVLSLSEDAWQGDAQFTISIDGQQVGGVRTATASHAAGQSQAFAIDTTLSAGTHQVGVAFVNDAWGGTASTDRNLFLNGATYNGQSVGGSTATLLSNGTASFSLTATDQAAPVTFPVTLTSAPAPMPAPAPVPSLVPVVAPSSGAYAFEGPKWASPTITWSFAGSTYAQDAATSFSSTIGAAYQSTVQQAVQRWAAVSGLNLVQQADGADPSKAASIRIGFADLNTPTSYTMGYTSYHYTSASNGSAAFSPDTIIRLEDPSKDALYAGSGGILTYQGFSTTLYQTVLHEFGHALGLDHSTDPNTVMYATLGPANTDLNASDIAGIQALYGTTPTPVAIPLPTIAAVPTPVPMPVPPPPGSLVLRLSEDAYAGDAQFTVSVDGRVLGPAQSVTARHGAGVPQAFSFAGDFAPGAHQVSISFLNDLWNPATGEDRNLYVQGITLNGASAPVAETPLYSAGHKDFTATAPTAATTPTPVPTPTPTDGLVVRLSEDAYQGDAQFTVSVDGTQLGAAQAVTARHGAGASQAFSFAGSFAPGAHQVSISFLNDLWNPGVGDRNLYIDGITMNGTSTPGATAALYSAGHSDFTVTAPAVATPTPTPVMVPVPTPVLTQITPDTLVLRLSEDAYSGDAQFTATVDGRALGPAQSVTALHGAGASQAFTFTGSFGPGAHDLAVTFVNDLWNPATGADRNLYVQGATLNGATSASPGGFVSGDTHQPLHLMIGTASAA